MIKSRLPYTIFSSLRGFNASMVDWASKDYSAVTQYIIDHFNDYQRFLIGHSFGGNSLGLSPMANSYDAYVTIVAPFAYWKFFAKSYQPAMLWTFFKPVFHGYFRLLSPNNKKNEILAFQLKNSSCSIKKLFNPKLFL